MKKAFSIIFFVLILGFLLYLVPPVNKYMKTQVIDRIGTIDEVAFLANCKQLVLDYKYSGIIRSGDTFNEYYLPIVGDSMQYDTNDSRLAPLFQRCWEEAMGENTGAGERIVDVTPSSTGLIPAPAVPDVIVPPLPPEGSGALFTGPIIDPGTTPATTTSEVPTSSSDPGSSSTISESISPPTTGTNAETATTFETAIGTTINTGESPGVSFSSKTGGTNLSIPGANRQAEAIKKTCLNKLIEYKKQGITFNVDKSRSEQGQIDQLARFLGIQTPVKNKTLYTGLLGCLNKKDVTLKDVKLEKPKEYPLGGIFQETWIKNYCDFIKTLKNTTKEQMKEKVIEKFANLQKPLDSTVAVAIEKCINKRILVLEGKAYYNPETGEFIDLRPLEKKNPDEKQKETNKEIEAEAKLNALKGIRKALEDGPCKKCLIKQILIYLGISDVEAKGKMLELIEKAYRAFLSQFDEFLQGGSATGCDIPNPGGGPPGGGIFVPPGWPVPPPPDTPIIPPPPQCPQGPGNWLWDMGAAYDEGIPTDIKEDPPYFYVGRELAEMATATWKKANDAMLWLGDAKGGVDGELTKNCCDNDKTIDHNGVIVAESNRNSVTVEVYHTAGAAADPAAPGTTYLGTLILARYKHVGEQKYEFFVIDAVPVRRNGKYVLKVNNSPPRTSADLLEGEGVLRVIYMEADEKKNNFVVEDIENLWDGHGSTLWKIINFPGDQPLVLFGEVEDYWYGDDCTGSFTIRNMKDIPYCRNQIVGVVPTPLPGPVPNPNKKPYPQTVVDLLEELKKGPNTPQRRLEIMFQLTDETLDVLSNNPTP